MTTSSPHGADREPPVSGLGYEQARDELVEVVRRLEAGPSSLEEALRLWERGEALAARCQEWLDGARRRIDELVAARERGQEEPQGDGSGP
ncbi:MAG: exodeoxyribonuclease VII small subunit [Actinomycetales bacterium]|nr:exodeoxyribonuclease VII small subunit [Actinomycetales bacterium]